MGVTRLLLLGPFYTIQTNFSILFCTRLYLCTVVQGGSKKIYIVTLLRDPQGDLSEYVRSVGPHDPICSVVLYGP